MKRFKYIIAVSLLALAGCSSGDVKETLGLRRSSPDEFNVVSNPPLYIPPEFNLPNPDAHSQEPLMTILDAPKEGSKPIKLNAQDAKFLKSLGDDNSIDKVKKMIDDEYNENKKKKKKKGLIRKAVAKLNSSEDEKYVDPILEKERLKKNQEENKPINEGNVPVKTQSTIQKILN